MNVPPPPGPPGPPEPPLIPVRRGKPVMPWQSLVYPLVIVAPLWLVIFALAWWLL